MRYVVGIFVNRDWVFDGWSSADGNDAYNKFIEVRSENIKKNDVGLFIDTEGGYESIELYDSSEDLNQDN